jgi:hypothetical protein
LINRYGKALLVTSLLKYGDETKRNEIAMAMAFTQQWLE